MAWAIARASFWSVLTAIAAVAPFIRRVSMQIAGNPAVRNRQLAREIRYDAKEEEGAHSLDVLSGVTPWHPAGCAVIIVRVSLREERGQPQPCQRRQAAQGESGEGKTPALGDHHGPRADRRARRGNR